MSLNIAPAEDLTQRAAPIIPMASVQINNQGYVSRDLFIRLPEGFVADDLKEPDVWKIVQSSPFALVKHDRLYMVAYDESWVAEAIVAQADRLKAVLAKPRLTNFPERFEKLFEDDFYRVAWVGSGYCVLRKTDNHRMTSPVSSSQIAERDLINLHPRVAGA
ncbi:hypothetical protein [Rhizobium sp. 21-4511-3d]